MRWSLSSLPTQAINDFMNLGELCARCGLYREAEVLTHSEAAGAARRSWCLRVWAPSGERPGPVAASHPKRNLPAPRASTGSTPWQVSAAVGWGPSGRGKRHVPILRQPLSLWKWAGSLFPRPLGLLKCNFSSKVRSLCVKAGWWRGSLSGAWLFSLPYFSFFVFPLEKASKDKC